MDYAAGQKRYFGRLAVPRVDDPGWDMYGEESEALVEGGRSTGAVLSFGKGRGLLVVELATVAGKEGGFPWLAIMGCCTGFAVVGWKKLMKKSQDGLV